MKHFLLAHDLVRKPVPTFRDHALSSNKSILPKKFEQRHQRQAENSEMIAFHTLEQMNANAFELIGPDARHGIVPHHVEIVVEKAVGEIAHGELRGIDAVEQHSAVAGTLKKYVADFRQDRKQITEALRKGAGTVPELAVQTGLPAEQVLWHVTAMRKYGTVQEVGPEGDYVKYEFIEQNGKQV